MCITCVESSVLRVLLIGSKWCIITAEWYEVDKSGDNFKNHITHFLSRHVHRRVSTFNR